MHGRSVEHDSGRQVARQEAVRVGDAYWVNQPHGKPSILATPEQIFRAVDKGGPFPKGTSQSRIRAALQTRKPHRLP